MMGHGYMSLNREADRHREADQRVCFRYTDSALSLLKSEISSFQSAYVTVQPDLCQA